MAGAEGLEVASWCDVVCYCVLLRLEMRLFCGGYSSACAILSIAVHRVSGKISGASGMAGTCSTTEE